ncbi:MAG TPA: UDP-N-acetylglucosamine--N-acetylmuramyl-(pentapeptide) pyrophosphoryl-undecaprenol N-acetylglucosamine transferase [Patescibacteria group bacterium]
MKIVIIGGHLSPAYAVVKELLKQGDEVIFFGRKHNIEGEKEISFEFEQIQNLGIPFIPITSGRLQRKFTIHTIPSLIKIPFGFFQALINLMKMKPDRVVGFGGYLSVPVIFSAWILGIKSITHEQTLKLGLANKINKLFVSKVAVSYQQTLKEIGKKGVLTGNPLREEIFNTQINDFRLKEFFENNKKQIIFATGGAQGSHRINLLIEKNLELVLSKFSLIHQIGRSSTHDDKDRLEAKRNKLAGELQKKYIICEYIGTKDIGGVLYKADLVISRAGANTTQELTILSRKAILIPIPFASHNEQFENAKLLESLNLAKILKEEQTASVDLIELIEQTLKLKVKKYGQNINLQNSAQKIIDQIKSL